jgi:Zn-dependent peptidase ImmA (M78 family)/RNA polymerase subunit RPABC4/transcription elongation factor Spt4
MMRTKPNFNKAKNLAFKVLIDHGITEFPIDILAIMSTYNDVKILTYSDMARKHKCSIEEIIEINSSEEGAIHYSAKKNKYLITYNDTINFKQRVYWTLAHEFGHYLMGHHKESNKSSLARNSMTEKEYNAKEVEANFFARFLVAPPPIITEAKIQDDYIKIMDFFGVSFTAATNILKYIEDSYKKGFKFLLPHTIRKLFGSFIDKIKHGKTCSNCNYFFVIQGSQYCPICGNDYLHNFFKGVESVNYFGYTLDEFGRALICPRCENEEISGEYCQICGIFLFNFCSGYPVEQLNEPFTGKWHENEKSCGAVLSGDARFCNKCGSTSTFLEQGLLIDWETEKEQKLERTQQDEDDSEVVFVGDDQFPF